MPKTSTNITWCIARLGKDFNWWVKKTSDPVNWDIADGLSILDPKQLAYVLTELEPLREFGLSLDIVENAFIPFQMEKADVEEKTVRLARVNELVQEAQDTDGIFALPDVANDESSAYADFLDHISSLRIQFLNSKIQFEQKLTIDEMEEHLREIQNQTYSEAKALHVFKEIADILEFIPEGYELPEEDDTGGDSSDSETREDEAASGYDIEEDVDEKIEVDGTMRWDDEGGEPSAEDTPFDEDEK